MGFFDWIAPVFNLFADRWSPRRIAEIAGMLEPHLGGRRAILDLGGGTGALAVRLATALDARVTVLDATAAMLRYVPDRPDVEGVLGTAEHMPFADGAFDATVVYDALHHFDDQDAAMREIVRVTRPGGGLYISEFDRRGFMRLLVGGEKALGEPGAFYAPHELCAYLERFDVRGRCTPLSKASYEFIGTVGAL